MLVNGREIATAVIAETRDRAQALADLGTPRLGVITCDPNFETQKYLALKQRKATAAGVALRVYEYPAEITTTALIDAVHEVAATSHGVIVQLPLPSSIDREAVLAAIPVGQDPDGFWYGRAPEAILPPVVASMVEIAKRHHLTWVGKKIAVLGSGRLVGQPVAHYLQSIGASFTVLTAQSVDVLETLRGAEIIISGVGKPGLVTADMVQAGVVVFDAGTSEDGGVLAGDVHPEVATKASIFTPVPGGIGPITVATLLSNVVTLAERQWQSRG